MESLCFLLLAAKADTDKLSTKDSFCNSTGTNRIPLKQAQTCAAKRGPHIPANARIVRLAVAVSSLVCFVLCISCESSQSPGERVKQGSYHCFRRARELCAFVAAMCVCFHTLKFLQSSFRFLFRPFFLIYMLDGYLCMHVRIMYYVLRITCYMCMCLDGRKEPKRAQDYADKLVCISAS